MESENNSLDDGKRVLTSIHGMYTLSTTLAEANQADAIMMKHFLQTLAEIALAVASRKSKGKEVNQ
jgi:hypothetical protein